jgi:DNA polymerase lambda
LLLDLVLELEKAGILTEHLVFPSASKDHSSLSYMGVCQLNSPHHRIDIKYYPIEQYPYALLYFTGSDMFNRSMRLYASKLGIQLNDHGATAKRRNPND